MKKFKLLITIIFSTFSFNVFALNQKPSIEVFVFGNQNYNHSIKLSISSHLNQNGFVTKGWDNRNEGYFRGGWDQKSQDW